jgi:outer membrane cobalamin receptor
VRVTLRRCFVALLVVATATPAWAQTTTPPDLGRIALEDLLNIRITTVSLTPESLADAPGRAQVVTSAQIARRGYRSLADLLKDLPDFKVDIAGDQDYPTELTVQGMHGASRVIVLLDGIRISSPTNEPLPILANYPVHSARQIEIVYGPASALYGADAFSAVINIISKDATEAAGLSVATSVGQFGLYNQTVSYGARLGANASLVLSGQFLYDHQPDLSQYYPDAFGGMQAQRAGVFPTIFGPMTPNRPISSTYDIPLSAHSTQGLFRSGGLQLSFFENQSKVSTTPAYVPDNGVYDPAAFNLNRLFAAAASYTKDVGRATSTSTLTMSRHVLDPQSGYLNVYSNMEKSYKYAYGSMMKAEEQVSWKPASAITVTTGGTFERFYSIPQGADLNAPIQSQQRPGTILDTNIPDDFVKVHYSNVGAYGQMQYAVSPAVSLTLGARADYNTRYEAALNPRVGLVARAPSGGTTWKLLYGSAFLAPSPYQAYSHYGSFYSTDGGKTFASDYWHLGNPDLQPQHKKTLETVLMQPVGGHVQVTVSAFHSWFIDIVKGSAADLSYAGTYHGWPVAYIDFPVNEGDARVYGLTISAESLHTFGSDGRLETHAALAWADGRVREDSESSVTLPVGLMAPVQLRFGADLDWHRWSAAPRLAIVGAQRLLATVAVGDSLERQTLAGYATVDVNIRRRNLFRNVDVFVTLENALDQRYRSTNARAYTNPEELIGAPQNPRRVSIGFELRLP